MSQRWVCISATGRERKEVWQQLLITVCVMFERLPARGRCVCSPSSLPWKKKQEREKETCRRRKRTKNKSCSVQSTGFHTRRHLVLGRLRGRRRLSLISQAADRCHLRTPKGRDCTWHLKRSPQVSSTESCCWSRYSESSRPNALTPRRHFAGPPDT